MIQKVLLGLCQIAVALHLRAQIQKNIFISLSFVFCFSNSILATDFKEKIKKDQNLSVVKILYKNDRKHVIISLVKDESGKLFVLKKKKLSTIKEPEELSCERKASVREMNFYKEFRSPFFLKIFEISSSTKEISFLLEPMDIDLFTYVRKYKIFPLEKMKMILAPILLGLNEIHEKKSVHRDLKPENTLLNVNPKDDEIISVKLSDFESVVLEGAGRSFPTNAYRPPESFKDSYKEVMKPYDLWNVGMIFFFMGSEGRLYEGRDRASDSPARHKKYIPIIASDKDALDLLVRLLRGDPNKRITVKEALEHPFLKSTVESMKISSDSTL